MWRIFFLLPLKGPAGTFLLCSVVFGTLDEFRVAIMSTGMMNVFILGRAVNPRQ